jgi:Peptidase M50B-like
MPVTVVTSATVQAVSKLPAPVAVLVGLISLGIVMVPELWALLSHFARIAHEGAHAIVGSVLDSRVTGVHLYRKPREDGTYGETGIRNEPGTGFALTVVGYFGPSGFGLAAAALIAHGLILLVLWTGVVLLAILLLSLRTLFGVALVVGVGFLLLSIVRSKNASVEAVAAYGLSWLLLLSGVRGVWDRRKGSGDADKLREITDVPQRLWFLFWLVGTVAAVIWGSTMLV